MRPLWDPTTANHLTQESKQEVAVGNARRAFHWDPIRTRSTSHKNANKNIPETFRPPIRIPPKSASTKTLLIPIKPRLRPSIPIRHHRNQWEINPIPSENKCPLSNEKNTSETPGTSYATTTNSTSRIWSSSWSRRKNASSRNQKRSHLDSFRVGYEFSRSDSSKN